MFIVTADEMYAIDHYTKDAIGFNNLLMENAGRAVCEKLYRQLKTSDHIIVFVGTGNNGGDGYVIARTLMNQHYDVTVAQIGSDDRLTDETAFHQQLYMNCGGAVVHVTEKTELELLFMNHDVVIDAMVGIGVKGRLREPLASIVTQMNQLARHIISIDIPSGLPSDEDDASVVSVKANETIVIGAPKLSAFLSRFAPYYGTWDVVSIGYPPMVFEKFATRYVSTKAHFKTTMPRRQLDSHKGDHGRGLVIGGSDDMPGALSMTTRAALTAGSGLITAATTEKVIDRMALGSPETMYLTLLDEDGYISAANHLSLDEYDGIALGIGMGRQDDTKQFIRRIIDQANCPLVIDADGLFHAKSYLQNIKNRHHPTIITPHPGEMAHLLNITIGELMAFPFRYSLEFAKTYHVYVILKGRFTIITTPGGKQAVNVTGNPGLAKGGSGDVLTGIVLAMVMQGVSVFDALRHACLVHGMSADLQVKDVHSEYDLTATDVIDGIRKVYRTFFN